MIRQTELELHRRAKDLFEAEHADRLWRQPSGATPMAGQRYAELVERQNYLARVRADMRREGVPSEVDEDAMAAAYRRPTSYGSK